MNATIGKKLKELRKQKGLTQEQTANYLFISQSAYARMESGESYSWATHLEKICQLFEITPETLLSKKHPILGYININSEGEHSEVLTQLIKKLIEQYETRLKEKEDLIEELQKKINH